ncbi:MAG: CoA transferase [Actinomycetia bacterium]|nr:CoA transferase [Actinomycetes bacterium]
MTFQPLAGVRVVSLAINLPGPVAAARMAGFGATVTKVEPPSGDPLAALAPDLYRELAAGQAVVTLDLKDPGDRDRLDSLLDQADVLLTSVRPSALDRLGLSDAAQRHDLVHVEIIGFGDERRDEAGHDLTYQAAHGLLRPPAMPLAPVADLLGGERAAAAACAGVVARARGGATALHYTVVLNDAARDAALGVRHGITTPTGLLGGALPAYGIYATADGHIAVGALEPHFAARLDNLVGRTREELAAAFAAAGNDHWEAFGREHDIPIVAVLEPGARPADD